MICSPDYRTEYRNATISEENNQLASDVVEAMM